MKLRLNENFVLDVLMTVDIHEGFVTVFNDKNPLHTNEKFACEKGFKGKVMHGNILNGFLSYFIGECLPMKNVIIHKQEIQYKNPVYLNDELRLYAEIIGIYESVNAYEFKYSFRNKEGQIVAKGKFQIGLLG